MRPARLLVVGGGIAGLAAAWEAATTGADVTLVEASGRLGGKVRTEEVDGFVVEHGPDAVVAYRPAALQLAGEVGLADEIVHVGPGRNVQVRAAGQLHPLPDGMGLVLPTRVRPFLGTRLLSWRDKARAARDLVLPRRLGPDDVAIGAFLRARLGGGIVTRLADPLVGGIYGASVDDLSLDAVLPTLRTSEREHRSLILASLAQGRAARRGAMTPGAASSPFRSLARGLGSLPQRLAERLPAAGVVVRLDERATRLQLRQRQTIVTFAGGSTDAFDGLVLAAGGAGESALLEAHAPAAAHFFHQLPRTSTAVVTLAYRTADLPGVTTHGWLDAGPAPVTGVTVSSTKWPGRAPAGILLLRAFLPERVGPVATGSDDEILAAVSGYVTEVLAAPAVPVRHWITRWTRAMPRYGVGHLARVRELEADLARYPTWQVAGSAVRGVGVPDCVADGRRAARTVLDHLAGTAGHTARQPAPTEREAS